MKKQHLYIGAAILVVGGLIWYSKTKNTTLTASGQKFNFSDSSNSDKQAKDRAAQQQQQQRVAQQQAAQRAAQQAAQRAAAARRH